jgi:hypothetical protein
MIKITRIYTEIETENALDKEYRDYYSVNRRIFYINDEALNNFKTHMQARREKDSIVQLEHIVKQGYVSQHWR